jgi:uncharacterized membrane protein
MAERLHRRTPRLVGIDVARGLAVIGMFVAHTAPNPDDVELFADGRSSMLFATLAGVSLGIMTGQAIPTPRGRRGDRVRSILIRAAVLFLLGVVLSTLGSRIAIILDYYAVMFLLATPLLFLARPVLAVVAAAVVVGGPLLADALPEQSPSIGRALLEEYLLLGYYPAIPWLFLLLIGLVAARSGLERPATRTAMVAGGTLTSVLGYGTAAVVPGITAAAHSDSTAELLGSGGLAIAVIGLMLWATSSSRIVRLVLSPVGAVGSMALTVYTLQILTLAVFARLRDATDGAIAYPGWPLLIGMTAGSLVFAVVWRRMLGRGPLERAVTLMANGPTPRA